MDTHVQPTVVKINWQLLSGTRKSTRRACRKANKIVKVLQVKTRNCEGPAGTRYDPNDLWRNAKKETNEIEKLTFIVLHSRLCTQRHGLAK
jgi:hypothetical protein